jgi:hypothetical protein
LTNNPKGSADAGKIGTNIKIVNTTKAPITISLYLSKNKLGECGYKSYALSPTSTIAIVNDLPFGCYFLSAFINDPKKPNQASFGPVCITGTDKTTISVLATSIKVTGPWSRVALMKVDVISNTSSLSLNRWFVTLDKLTFRVHALQRMFERRISVKTVKNVLEVGEVIEDYSMEMPEPSRLILGFLGKRPIHVVVSENISTNELTIITVYVPDPDKWKKDYRRRNWQFA